MANIRFVKAPNDNRVRPISAVAMGDLNHNSPLTPDNKAHASAQRYDNAKTRPNKDIRNTEGQDLFSACNNNEPILSSTARVSGKEDDRGNNYTDSRFKLSKRQSFKEGVVPASEMDDSDNENEKCTKANDTLKYVANKVKETVSSRTSGGESSNSAKIALEQTKRRRADNELNATQMKGAGAKETQDVSTKVERKKKEPDLMPETSKSGNTSRSGIQQQDQQKQKGGEEKQSTSHPSHCQQPANRQNAGNTAQQYRSQSGNRTLYRSISEAEITDEPSFFRSISDVKYYGLDSDDDETENNAGNSKENRIFPGSTSDYQLKGQDEMKTVKQDGVSKSGLDSSKSKSGRKAENESTLNVEKNETTKQGKKGSTEEKKANVTQEQKTIRQDGVYKSGVDSSSKTKVGGKAENENESNMEKSQTIKRNQQQSPEEKTPRMVREKNTETMEGNTGSTIAVVKSKISEAIKTGFKKLDNMDEKNVYESKGNKVNTVTEDRKLGMTQNKTFGERKVDKMHDEIQEDQFCMAQSKITDSKNLGLAQSKMVDENKFGTTEMKTREDKRSGETKTHVLDEKKRNSSGETNLNTLGESKSINDNNILDGTKRKLAEGKKLGMRKRSTIEDNMCDILKEKNVYASADNKISMFDGNRSGALGETQLNISEEKRIPETQSKISTEKNLVLTQDKRTEGRTQSRPSEDNKSSKAQGKMSEEKTLDMMRNKPRDEKIPECIQSRISEENKVGTTPGKISEDRKSLTMQTKISEEKSVGVTQNKILEDKQLDLAYNKMTEDQKRGLTSNNMSEERQGLTQGKTEDKRVMMTQSKQVEVAGQRKTGVVQNKTSEDKKFGSTQDKIEDEKKVSAMEGKLPEKTNFGKISENKTFKMQEEMSGKMKMAKNYELLENKYNTPEDTKCQAIVDKKNPSMGEKKTITTDEKYDVRDYKDVTVAQDRMLKDKTKGKMVEEKKGDVTAGKVLEDKQATTQHKLNDKKLAVPQAGKVEERKGGRVEEKKGSKSEDKAVKESKDSTLDAKKNKMADMSKGDNAEGAKLKSKKKERNKLDASKCGILNETTSKILEQRKNAAKKKRLDEESSLTGQRGNVPNEVKSDDTSQKADLTFDQDSTELDSEARLKKRRAALSNPEKMIMSQEQREKIEKDVEKTKTSVAKKVSKFLNVQLGLNKEEDLI